MAGHLKRGSSGHLKFRPASGHLSSSCIVCPTSCTTGNAGAGTTVLVDFTHFDPSLASSLFMGCSTSPYIDHVISPYYGANLDSYCYASGYPATFSVYDCTCVNGYRVGWFIIVTNSSFGEGDPCWVIDIGSSSCLGTGAAVIKKDAQDVASCFGTYTATGLTGAAAALNGQYITVSGCSTCSDVPSALMFHAIQTGDPQATWNWTTGTSCTTNDCIFSSPCCTERALLLNRTSTSPCTYVGTGCVGCKSCTITLTYSGTDWTLVVSTGGGSSATYSLGVGAICQVAGQYSLISSTGVANALTTVIIR